MSTGSGVVSYRYAVQDASALAAAGRAISTTGQSGDFGECCPRNPFFFSLHLSKNQTLYDLLSVHGGFKLATALESITVCELPVVLYVAVTAVA